MMKFITKPKEIGGLGHILPGTSYEEMKALQVRATDETKR